MKKKLSFILALILALSPTSFAAWDKTKPAGSDLISDIDTLVVANNTALESTLSGLRGWVNLKASRTNATTVAVTADQLYLQGTATIPMRLTSVSESIAITTSGAGGLDTGAEGNKWYYIWIIAKADGTVDGLLSASSSSPTMPATYVFKALVSAVHNTAGDFLDFKQTGRDYDYGSSPIITSGNTGASWVSVDMTEIVPSGLSDLAKGTAFLSVLGYLTNDSSVATTTNVDRQKIGNNASSSDMSYWEFKMLTASTLYVYSTDAATKFYCSGFTLNKL